MRRLTLCALSLAFIPAAVHANSPPVPSAIRYLQQPDNAKQDKTPLGKQIALVENVPVTFSYQLDLARPKLIIPQKYAITDGKAQKAEAEPGGSRNLFAGLALSAAFVTGGIWLVRRGGKAAKVLLAVAVGSGLVSAAVMLPQVLGNVSNLPLPKETTPIETNGNTLNLGMDVVIVAEGDRIQVLLPKRTMPAIMIPRENFDNAIDPFADLIKKENDAKKGNR